MRNFESSVLFSIFLLLAGCALPFSHGAKTPLRSLQVRTDLIRLIPFQVQIAIQDETTPGDSETIALSLYQGGSLLTDTISDWMRASFDTKTTGDQALLINNYTTFDSIALELDDNSASTGTIDGQVLDLIQLSFVGVTLWKREGTGTPPMEPEMVELIQRATFLESRTLKASLQSAVNNMLFQMGIDSIDGVQPIIVVDVRAYITPPGTASGGDEEQQGEKSSADDTVSNTNRNLEIIIIVAIVVACLAFALLIFAVIWAWRSDRRERDEKPKRQRKASKPKPTKPLSEPSTNGALEKPTGLTQTTRTVRADPEVNSPAEQQSSYDLPNNSTDGSYPKEIGNSNRSSANYPEDSVISEDVSSSLSAYYKAGMGYSGSQPSSTGAGRPSDRFNDAASMSSMDSYGYSLDGYAPSLGPTQGGYPVGPLQAARDAPMPVGDDIRKLQDEESVADYDSGPAYGSRVSEA